MSAAPTIEGEPVTAPASPAERLPQLVLWGLPALVAVLVFANTLGNDLVYDDRWTVGRIQPLSLAGVLDDLGRTRGLTYVVHSLDRWLWGDWIPGFHLTNVFLHAVASGLAAVVAATLTTSRRIGLVAGLLFAVHPVHSEVVASFAYRKDSLAFVFVMLGLLAWLRVERPLPRYAAVLACLALGLSAKEVAAVGLVPMLFFADLLPRPGETRGLTERIKRAGVRSAPLLLLGIGVTAWLLASAPGESVATVLEHNSNGVLVERSHLLATAFASIPEAIRLLAFPFTLSADYPLRPEADFAAPRVQGGVVLAALILFATFAIARRSPVGGFAAAWTWITYLPCSNVVPVNHFFVAERYLYVPSFGLCLLAAMAFDRILVSGREAQRPGRVRFAQALLVIVLIAGSVRSFARTRDWRSGIDLWSASLRDGVQSERIHANLSVMLLANGQPIEAIEQLERGQALHPCTKWYVSLAEAHAAAGDREQAIEFCKLAIDAKASQRRARDLLERLREERAAERQQRAEAAGG